ncbi:hypothetical protein [Arcanobacterium canis]
MGKALEVEKFVRVLDHALLRPDHFVKFNLEGLSDAKLDQVVKFCNADESYSDGEVCKTARRIRKRRLETKLRQARLELVESELADESAGLEFE